MDRGSPEGDPLVLAVISSELGISDSQKEAEES